MQAQRENGGGVRRLTPMALSLEASMQTYIIYHKKFVERRLLLFLFELC